MRTILIVALTIVALTAKSQNLDSLKNQILQLEVKTNDINFRMEAADRQFKTGILVSTLGYSITIAGGLMLGRDNDDLGQVLLVTGGVTVALGTYILVDSFSVLSGKRKKKRRPK